MAVSKRTRFEVLRRDDHTCRYCRSRDNALTIDHVVPVSLGGTDDPNNLVACCKDCNSGKSSSNPDATLVADVENDALRWAAARKVAAARLAVHRERHAAFHKEFYEEWVSWNKSADCLPNDWTRSLDQWLDLGITGEQIIDAHWIAAGKRHIRADKVFTYMAGIIRNWIIELDEATRGVLAGEGDE